MTIVTRSPPPSRPVLVLVLVLSITTTARAGRAGPDVGTILDAMRTASGGTGWSAVHSLHAEFTVASGGEIGRGERWEDAATGRYVERVAWPTHGDIDGFDGVTPWHQGRSGIAYTLGDVDAALVAADESFRVSRGSWFPDRHPATIAPAGTRMQDGRGYDLLDVTPEGGRPFEAWVDRTTHLLARTDEQQAEDRVVATYADYRPVKGLMLPFSIRVGDGEDAFPCDDASRSRVADTGSALRRHRKVASSSGSRPAREHRALIRELEVPTRWICERPGWCCGPGATRTCRPSRP